MEGARPEEILGSPKSAFNPATGQLVILKGKSKASRRTLYLMEDSQAILQARMTTPGIWLFPGRLESKHIVKINGSHNAACMSRPTNADPEPRQLTFVPYDLRHTFGTRMAPHTDPFTLAAIMGHSNLRTIMKYVHPQDDAKKAAMQRYEGERNRAKLKVVSK